jgi:lysophospholipase L1-like esterase
MRIFLCVAVAMGIGARWGLAQSRDTSVPSVKLNSGEAQLFVDDHLIAWQSNLKRTLHQPIKDHGGNAPVLAIEDEFGATKSTLEANGTILYDTKLKKWVMYSLAFASSWPGASADRVRLYRFTSPDAMNWVKGDDGDPQRIAIDLDDPVSKTIATNVDQFSCMYDETDPDNPGDSLNHQVVFDGRRSLREVASDGVVQLRFTVDEGGALYSFTIDPDRGLTSAVAKSESTAGTMKTETFDRDPGWVGVNNRSARTIEPVQIRQDFGFSPETAHASGGRSKDKGEIGGVITPAGEVAFYGKAIKPMSFDEPLSASGTMTIAPGGTHLLLGFFNATSVNEWRTPNTVAIRLNGRGDNFFAYVEYCTSKWRAGGDTTPFPSVTDPATGRWNLIGFPCQQSLRWTLNYDPQGNDGKGVVTATIGEHKAICNLDDSHKLDGATFTHFGIINVMKSADSGSEVWFDNISINGSKAEAFSRDPKWEGRNNRKSYETRIVRPRFDFGFSDTTFAGGKGRGELGGQIFRGDCRYPDKMASYGDRIGPLTLDKPLTASGKVAMRRGVSDSTTLFGFYNSKESMRSNESQSDGLPESVVGIHIEGPSSEGFQFYPVLRKRGGGSQFGAPRTFPSIMPDGKVHDWSMAYDPQGAAGKGQITVTLDSRSNTFDLSAGDKERGTTFDRFGIVTSWIDGNSQDVYWDDVSYTVGQNSLEFGEKPLTIVCLGDSVTGVYYHTGGRRAYPEMLEVAIKQAIPKANVKVINAGISGHSTPDGLARLDRDVLMHKPDLVTISFGLNDMTRLSEEQYRTNLETLVARCREAKASVVLCTPNSVITTTGRPIEKLKRFCDVIRATAKSLDVPVCDQFAAGESLREKDAWAFRCTLSDEIHPNMDGHKRMAEELCRTITGRSVSLSDVGPLQPALVKTRMLLESSNPVKILAMPPFDALIGPALKELRPDATIEVTVWPTDGKSLAELEQAAKQTVRAMKPDLVVIAVPAAATAATDEEFFRSYSWIMNWSLSFGHQEWDCLVVHPSVSNSDAQNPRSQLIRQLVKAQELTFIDRPTGDTSKIDVLFTKALRRAW